ncbi:hypothetical protein AB205_0128630, partial [Aquarana catesbeiana]
EPPKEDLTVSEKFQLVLDVAQKAQLVRFRIKVISVADLARYHLSAAGELPTPSRHIPVVSAAYRIRLYAGIKFFLIDFVFKRCPRLRDKYDTPYIIWTNLPTDPQLKERTNATVSRRIQTVSSRSNVATGAPQGVSRDEEGGRYHSTKKSSFHEIFSLAETERPLPACENGWRCCLINRDKKMPTDYIRNGVLYVTENYICFESSRSGSSKKNKIIKLTDITDIQKPLVFGAMVHRDEAFETIFTQYVKITSTVANNDT